MSKITGSERIIPTKVHYKKVGLSETITGFPENADWAEYEYGLTIRQHFAAMNLQGMLSNSDIELTKFDKLIELAVILSDLLIEELNKPQQNA
jgi:hypothetical protein